VLILFNWVLILLNLVANLRPSSYILLPPLRPTAGSSVCRCCGKLDPLPQSWIELIFGSAVCSGMAATRARDSNRFTCAHANTVSPAKTALTTSVVIALLRSLICYFRFYFEFGLLTLLPTPSLLNFSSGFYIRNSQKSPPSFERGARGNI
jgi:hypothetical protein